MVGLLKADAELRMGYVPGAMISQYSISPSILSAIPCVKLCRIG